MGTYERTSGGVFEKVLKGCKTGKEVVDVIVRYMLGNKNVTKILISNWYNLVGEEYFVDERGIERKEVFEITDKEVAGLLESLCGERYFADINEYEVNGIAVREITKEIQFMKKNLFSLNELVKNRFMTEEMKDFLIDAVRNQRNILIVGEAGAGKSTLLRSLIRESGVYKLVTFESDVNSLKLGDISLVYGKEWHTFSRSELDLIKRLNPNYYVVDEVRDRFNYIVCNPFIGGIHGSDTKDGLYRLELSRQLCFSNDLIDNRNLINVCDYIDYVVVLKRFSDGRRRIVRISEPIGVGIVNGVKRNNLWVSKNKLDDSFMIKGGNEKEMYVQDLFRYDYEKDLHVRTGWKSMKGGYK